MKRETLSAHMRPEMKASELAVIHGEEWRSLLKGTRALMPSRRESHAERLHESASALFRLIVENDDLGNTITEAAEYNFDAKRGFKTFSLSNKKNKGVKHYFHILGHSEQEYGKSLAFELFETRSRNIDLSAGYLPSENPNYNRPHKIAGLWVGEDEQIGADPESLAVLHDTHETLAALVMAAKIEMPDKFYYGFHHVIEQQARHRH